MMFLFDIDGTLVSTGAGAQSLERAVVDLHGIDGTLDGFRLDGMTDPVIVEHIFTAHIGRPARDGEVDAVIDRYLVHLEAAIATTDRYRVLPGVPAALDFLEARGGMTVGLATGNVERGAAIKLKRGDLWRRFPFGGYGSDAGDRAKLVARAIERGTTRAGRAFAGHEVFVIGDTPRDVAAAHACGAVAVGVATGPHSTDDLRKCGAEVVMETLDEFPAWAEGVLG